MFKKSEIYIILSVITVLFAFLMYLQIESINTNKGILKLISQGNFINQKNISDRIVKNKTKKVVLSQSNISEALNESQKNFDKLIAENKRKNEEILKNFDKKNKERLRKLQEIMVDSERKNKERLRKLREIMADIQRKNEERLKEILGKYNPVHDRDKFLRMMKYIKAFNKTKIIGDGIVALLKLSKFLDSEKKKLTNIEFPNKGLFYDHLAKLIIATSYCDKRFSNKISIDNITYLKEYQYVILLN